MTKTRLDLLLVERGLAESRAKAQALVMAGQVRVDGQVERKASAERRVTDGPRGTARTSRRGTGRDTRRAPRQVLAASVGSTRTLVGAATELAESLT